MDNLRLILIGIGLAILAAIILFHRPSGRRKPHARKRPSGGRVEPGFEAGGRGEPGPDDSGESEQPPLPRLYETAQDAESTRFEPAMDTARGAKARAAHEPEPEKIVTVYVRGRRETRITGVELLDAAIRAGLSFGEMNIFHRRHEGADKPVFSMADLTPPGDFDPSGWNLFDTEGVTLFMTLPGPVSALDAWDAMLATGRRLAELLKADLLDDSHCLLTRQRVAQIREDMREYDRRAGLSGDE